MAATYSLTLFTLSLIMTTVLCQTFQYSHGWRNGKRSMFSMVEELVNSASKNAGQLDNVLASCELQKLKLLLQRNVNSPLLQVPCELFAPPKRNNPEPVISDHIRRQSTSVDNNL